jgi:hypothetical protein
MGNKIRAPRAAAYDPQAKRLNHSNEFIRAQVSG